MRKFNEFCEHFKVYIANYGDGFVPSNYVCEDSFKLGYYVLQVRSGRSKLTQEEKDTLNFLHFEWRGRDKKLFNSTFAKYYAIIKKYYNKYGNCDIPEKFIDEDGEKVGIMVARLREIKSKLNPNQVKELDEIGFNWRKKNKKTNFEDFCKLHEEYRQEKGHCYIPVKYVNENGVCMGEICRNIRNGAIKINKNQKKKLDSIGFVWNPVTYRKEHGLLHSSKSK